MISLFILLPDARRENDFLMRSILLFDKQSTLHHLNLYRHRYWVDITST